jgi:hypothetical protein
MRGDPFAVGASVKLESQPVESSQGNGVGGIARLVAVLSVLLLAAVGILMVLEVIPLSVFGEFSAKLLGVGAIALVAAIAIALLSKR